MKTPLYNHISPETAYVVEDYPYGFRARCKIRYWLETSPKKGVRFVSQTTNPKTGAWNKPKASTYALVGGCMYLDENNHVQWSALTEYTEASKVLEFIKTFPGIDLASKILIQGWCKGKAQFSKGRANGSITFTMNGNRISDSSAEIDRNIAEYKIWEECDKLLEESQVTP